MSSDAFAEMDNNDLSEVDPVAGSDNLNTLLEDEYFLVKVLACVLDDGLHECRLVCRRWRDACGKLPVVLKKQRIPSDKLPRAADLFPEAKTLGMSEEIHSADVETHLVPQLQRLKNLNHFSLFFSNPIDLRNVVACFSSMQHLCSLQLRINHEDTMHRLVHDLHYLKKLTSLYLAHTCHLQKDLDPVDCVQGLSQLDIDIDLLINRRGELVFPMLTGLTELNTYRDVAGDPQQLPYNLQSIVPFAPSLQSLNIHSDFEESSLTGPSPWRSFLRLSNLVIDAYGPRDTSIFQALKQMRHLRSLSFDVSSERDEQGFVESMPSLTGLRSFTLRKCILLQPILSKITEHLTVLAQLTQLRLRNATGSHSLRFPKGIVNLDLFFLETFPEDLPEELMQLTSLTSLKLHSEEETQLFRSGRVTPCNLFKELGQLKTLSLWNVCVDRPFLDAFIALTGLTELRLGGWRASMDPKLLCQQLSLLSNLRVLSFPFPSKMLVDSEAGVPQGCLAKLRKIEGFLTEDAIDAYSELVKAFPCLRNVR